MKLISIKDLPANERTRPLIVQLRRIIFDANVYIMLGMDDQYIYGKRCYEKAMKLVARIRQKELIYE